MTIRLMKRRGNSAGPLALAFVIVSTFILSDARADGQRWYVHPKGATSNLGPWSQAEVEAKVRDGTVSLSDLVWTAGQAKWLPLSEVGAFNGAPSLVGGSEAPRSRAAIRRPRTRPTENSAPGASRTGPYITGLGGLAMSFVEGASPYFMYGAGVGYRFSFWDIGFVFQQFSTTSVVSALTLSGSMTNAMLSLTANWNSFYAGARAGLGLQSLSFETGGVTTSFSGSAPEFAPVVGARWSLSSSFSLGVDVPVIFVLPMTLGSVATSSLTYYLAPTATLTFKF
jgi:hypothetical protein